MEGENALAFIYCEGNAKSNIIMGCGNRSDPEDLQDLP